jgi:HPt (histidine-containing phosphotransfer) domain-containing protein
MLEKRIVSDLIDGGEIEEARRWLHNLEGVAANLSAHRLRRSSRGLEEAIASGANPAAALEHFAKALSQLLGKIHNLFPQEEDAPRPAPATSTPNPEEVNQRLEELAHLIKRHDLGARELVLELMPSFAAEDTRPLAEQLLSRLERFDFANAAKMLTSLVQLYHGSGKTNAGRAPLTRGS